MQVFVSRLRSVLLVLLFLLVAVSVIVTTLCVDQKRVDEETRRKHSPWTTDRDDVECSHNDVVYVSYGTWH